MKKNNFLEYLISSGLRKVIPSLYNFSFSFTNLVLYYLFLNYFNLNPIIFLILSVITFGLIGKLNNFWNYLLFCVVYTGILSFGYYTNIGLLVTLTLIAIFTVILILFSTFYKFEAPKERYRIRRKYVIAFPRLIFLNISYLLFPLLFIWLLSVGILLFFNSTSLTTGTDEFLTIIMTLGVIFGFFQYYLKRYEENIQEKMVAYISKIAFPKEEFSFENFREFLEESNKNEAKATLSIVKNVTSNKNNMIYRIFAKSVRSGSKEIYSPIINVYSPGSEFYFSLLEEEVKEKGKEDVLVKVYKEFFHKKKSEIVEKIDDKELDEMFWILLGNVNLLEEKYVSLVTLQEPKEEPKTYEDFMLKTSYEIVDEIITKKLFKKQKS